MKRLGFRWAAGLVGAGAAMGAAWAIAVGGDFASAHGSQEMPAVSMASADAAHDHCNDACVRSRGTAALVVLSQRPPQ
ncbi:hypothetical protein CF68_03110 [Cupriavidus sp. SK-4]|uniref:hypothetical protein n=1 Tax=Cupriavidus sp. SK-4 TaxID=574750 RepID=UPI000450D1FB|nr:hypothetical protein [Cupriavidus sp. SK-4]EYS87355.1 hypothetical protein CF68_03110 [Cupriavidus sp. SK-4]